MRVFARTDGKCMATPFPDLFEYGIHTEGSDIRAHVSVVNRIVYVFQTFRGIEAIEKYNPELRKAGQNGVQYPTAEGWLAKPEWIEDLRRLKFFSWAHWPELNENQSTSKKGVLAVRCVVDAIRSGRFPFWLDTSEDDRKNIQIKGTDIVVFCRKKIQVKCDYRSGDIPNGTGNLFLQKAERSPLKRK